MQASNLQSAPPRPAPLSLERLEAAAPGEDFTGWERQALAQRLHDRLCQDLSGLQLLARLAERKASAHCPELAPDLHEIQEIVRRASEEVHALVHSLRAPPGPGLHSVPRR